MPLHVPPRTAQELALGLSQHCIGSAAVAVQKVDPWLQGLLVTLPLSWGRCVVAGETQLPFCHWVLECYKFGVTRGPFPLLFESVNNAKKKWKWEERRSG